MLDWNSHSSMTQLSTQHRGSLRCTKPALGSVLVASRNVFAFAPAPSSDKHFRGVCVCAASAALERTKKDNLAVAAMSIAPFDQLSALD